MEDSECDEWIGKPFMENKVKGLLWMEMEWTISWPVFSLFLTAIFGWKVKT